MTPDELNKMYELDMGEVYKPPNDYSMYEPYKPSPTSTWSQPSSGSNPYFAGVGQFGADDKPKERTWGTPTTTPTRSSANQQPQINYSGRVPTMARPADLPEYDTSIIDKYRDIAFGALRSELQGGLNQGMSEVRGIQNPMARIKARGELLSGYGKGLRSASPAATQEATSRYQPEFAAATQKAMIPWDEYNRSFMNVSGSGDATDQGIQDMFAKFKKLGGNYA